LNKETIKPVSKSQVKLLYHYRSKLHPANVTHLGALRMLAKS